MPAKDRNNVKITASDLAAKKHISSKQAKKLRKAKKEAKTQKIAF